MDTTARFVAAYAGYSGPEPTACSSTEGGVQLKAQVTVSGLAAVCRHIAQNSSKAQSLLASSPETDAQVDEWLSWATTELTPLVDAKLFKLNDHLQSRTFLVGSSLTLADLVVFGVVQPAAVAFPAAQTLHFCNLLRWAELVQHLAGPSAAAVFPKAVSVPKPKFVAPVLAAAAPKPAPAAAAAAPAGKDAGKAKDAAAAAAPAGGDKKKGGEPKPAAEAAAKPAGAEAAAAKGKPADAAAAAGAAAAATAAKPKAEGKEPKARGEGKGAAEAKKPADEEPHIGMLDIRVGTIVKVDKHPNAEALYLEEIDLGEDKPRQVISGLVKFVPVEKMQNRRVVVVCNLKPAKMREIMSYGMVLCASNDAHDCVDPITPPEGVPNGERITFEGFNGPPLEEVNPKKKILERLFPDMVTDANCTPNYKGAVFMTSKGPVTATMPSAHVA